MQTLWLRPLIIVVGVYDGILALLFLLFWEAVFRACSLESPNHHGILHFSAILVLIVAAIFFRITLGPAESQDLIPYRIRFKTISSCAVFDSQLSANGPFIWLSWTSVGLVFLVLFLIAYKLTASLQPLIGDAQDRVVP